MKELTSHINFLMQKHDCVIIPDFGGFVLHREVASIAANGSITPPRVSVGFNPELKYNDGLLAESYMNAYSVSYDAAYARIEEAVKKMNAILGLHKPVEIGRLGILQLGEGSNYNFTPNLHFSSYHPETFGLSTIELKRLVDIHELQTTLVSSNRRSLYKRLFTGASAAAAALLVFFLSSTPISENADTSLQKSGFFFEMLAPTQAKSIDPNSSFVAESKDIQETIARLAPISEPVDPIKQIKETPVQVKDTKPLVAENVEKPKVVTAKYYVIIGSTGSKLEGQKALSRLKAQGFNNAQLISSSNRVRIYIAAFENKQQAEVYRADFVKENPSLSDAWVHAQRN